MNSNFIPSPEAALRALRQYFVEHNVQVFEYDEASIFGFLTTLHGTELLINAGFDQPALGLRLESALFCKTVRSAAENAQLANAINSLVRYCRVTCDVEVARFELQSILLLSDGMCLQGQVHAFGQAHMACVAKFAPLLGRFARDESSLSECIQHLELLKALDLKQKEVAAPAEPTPEISPADRCWRN